MTGQTNEEHAAMLIPMLILLSCVPFISQDQMVGLHLQRAEGCFFFLIKTTKPVLKSAQNNQRYNTGMKNMEKNKVFSYLYCFSRKKNPKEIPRFTLIQTSAVCCRLLYSVYFILKLFVFCFYHNNVLNCMVDYVFESL